MNEIEQFITAFIEFEYEANKLRYDTSISDEECLKQKDTKNLYLHSIISHFSVGRISGELEKFFSKELITVSSRR